MGDPENPISLPPGCRFYPSEEQLLCYYLTHKNSNDDRRFGFDDVINEVDLYSFNPFDLPDAACFRFGRGGRKRHWYCYVASRVLRKESGRRAGGGYWKRRGQVRDVVGGGGCGGGGKVVVGTRKRFVFYLGDSVKTAVRTEWVMYEYGLIDHLKDSFNVCRVFIRSCCQNNNSEHVLSSCGEGSIATVRHIGVQHDGAITSVQHDGAITSGQRDGAITSGIGEGIVHDDNSADRKDEVFTGSVGAVGTGTLAGVEVPLSIHPDEPVMASGLTGGASMFIGCFAAHHLMSILEEDFIELDDLECPLSDLSHDIHTIADLE